MPFSGFDRGTAFCPRLTPKSAVPFLVAVVNLRSLNLGDLFVEQEVGMDSAELVIAYLAMVVYGFCLGALFGWWVWG